MKRHLFELPPLEKGERGGSSWAGATLVSVMSVYDFITFETSEYRNPKVKERKEMNHG